MNPMLEAHIEDLKWEELSYIEELVPEPEPEVEEPRRPSRKELKRRTKERHDARKFKTWRTAQVE